MIFDAPNGSANEIKNGFVGIETAELLRQQATVSKFRTDHVAEFQALVDATVAVKLAHQKLEAAKAAARSLPTGLPMTDLLDEVERQARAALAEAASADEAARTGKPNAPTASQIQQKGAKAA